MIKGTFKFFGGGVRARWWRGKRGKGKKDFWREGWKQKVARQVELVVETGGKFEILKTDAHPPLITLNCNRDAAFG
jgi:hypothetical protein